MTSLIGNNKFFTTNICSVKVKYEGANEKTVPLSKTDKCKIFAAFFFGSLLLGVGVLLGFKVSRDLRNRKIEALQEGFSTRERRIKIAKKESPVKNTEDYQLAITLGEMHEKADRIEERVRSKYAKLNNEDDLRVEKTKQGLKNDMAEMEKEATDLINAFHSQKKDNSNAGLDSVKE